MKIILVRHGETLFNQLGLTQGWCDSPLTEKGIGQVRVTRDRLADIPIDEAYSSPSERACDTAEIILEGRGIELKRDKQLKEINFGYFEGSPNITRVQIACPGGVERGTGYGRFGGEEREEVIRRETEFLNSLLCDEEKTVLLAGHGAALNLLLHHIAGESLAERFPEFTFFHNATAVILSYADGRFEVEQVMHAEQGDSRPLRR